MYNEFQSESFVTCNSLKHCVSISIYVNTSFAMLCLCCYAVFFCCIFFVFVSLQLQLFCFICALNTFSCIFFFFIYFNIHINFSVNGFDYASCFLCVKSTIVGSLLLFFYDYVVSIMFELSENCT